MRICASGEYTQNVDGDLLDLKPVVKDATDQSLRRVSRFIQMAVIGASRCVAAGRSAGMTLPITDTGVYLASARGDMEVTIEVLEQLFRDGLAPKPLSFINTVSNAACFYVAQMLGLDGRSCFVCNRYFAFENALRLAMLDLLNGVVQSALVGVIDVVVPPLAVHRDRLEIAADAQVAEASHWLWLTADNTHATSELSAVHQCADTSALLKWIDEQSLDRANTLLSSGLFIPASLVTDIQQHSGLTQRFDYRDALGYYDSHSAAAPSRFIQEYGGQQKTLLHINSDPLGRYSAMLLRS